MTIARCHVAGLDGMHAARFRSQFADGLLRQMHSSRKPLSVQRFMVSLVLRVVCEATVARCMCAALEMKRQKAVGWCSTNLFECDQQRLVSSCFSTIVRSPGASQVICWCRGCFPLFSTLHINVTMSGVEICRYLT